MFRLRILSRIQIQNSLRSNQVIKRSKLGQSWVKAVKSGSNRADQSQYTQHTYVSTPNFVRNSNSRFFEVKLGHQEVELGSKPSNQGQIGQISRNVPNIHMVRLQILPRIQIKNSLRSNQVIRRSNLGQNRQIRVESGQVVGIYPICMCFDSEFCQELEFVIISCFWVKKSRLSVSVLHFIFV